jgi:hypothetical protein
MAARLLALWAGRPLSKQVFSFMSVGLLSEVKNSSRLIRNRTRDFLACIIASESTTEQHVRKKKFNHCRNLQKHFDSITLIKSYIRIIAFIGMKNVVLPVKIVVELKHHYTDLFPMLGFSSWRKTKDGEKRNIY